MVEDEHKNRGGETDNTSNNPMDERDNSISGDTADGGGVINNKNGNRLTLLREYLKHYGTVTTGFAQRSFDSCTYQETANTLEDVANKMKSKNVFKS